MSSIPLAGINFTGRPIRTLIGESTQDHAYDVPEGAAHDFFHANALAVWPDRNYLVFASANGDPETRSRDRPDRLAAGRQKTTSLVNDPLGSFNHQLPAGTEERRSAYTIDNGVNHTPPRSRLVEYAIEESAKTATLVWSHDIPLTDDGGSAQRLDNGDTLLGLANEIDELDPAGNTVWTMTLDFAIYRAQFIPSL